MERDGERYMERWTQVDGEMERERWRDGERKGGDV